MEPEYNIITSGKPSPGFMGKTYTEKSRALIRAAASDIIKPAIPDMRVEIIDFEAKLTTIYESVRKAAKAIGSNIKSIVRHEKRKKKKKPDRKRNKYTM